MTVVLWFSLRNSVWISDPEILQCLATVLFLKVPKDSWLYGLCESCDIFLHCHNWCFKELKNLLHWGDAYMPEMASVKSVSGPSVLLTTYKDFTILPCRNQVSGLPFRGEHLLNSRYSSCSSTLWIIACLDPHLVGHLVLSLCSGCLSSFRTSASSLFFFQL